MTFKATKVIGMLFLMALIRAAPLDDSRNLAQNGFSCTNNEQGTMECTMNKKLAGKRDDKFLSST